MWRPREPAWSRHAAHSSPLPNGGASCVAFCAGRERAPCLWVYDGDPAALTGGEEQVQSYAALLSALRPNLAPGAPFCGGRTDATDGAGSVYLRNTSSRLHADTTSG